MPQTTKVSPKLILDKDKYLKILRTQGYDSALTALHRDTEVMEFEVFEGEKGYQRPYWDRVEEVREFSRELWRLANDRTATQGLGSTKAR